MLHCRLTNDRQTESDPLGFSGDERLEQLGGDLRRWSGTVVVDFEDDIIIFGIGFDFNVSAGSGGLDAVHDKIE